jgi:hypothetical protein
LLIYLENAYALHQILPGDKVKLEMSPFVKSKITYRYWIFTMKVRASVKKEVPSAKLCVEKDIVRYKQKILDLNKDKDNYGKNSRGRYPEKQERCYSTYLHLWIRKQ